MNAQRAACKLGEQALRRLLSVTAELLPGESREWGAAMMAEFDALAGLAARVRFAAGGVVGMLRIALREASRGRIADGRTALAALLLGLGLAAIDLSVGDRRPLLAGVALGTLTLAVVSPRATWRWALLIAGMLPLCAWLLGFPAPYAHDRADVWYPLFPAVLIGLIGGIGGRRIRRKRGRSDSLHDSRC